MKSKYHIIFLLVFLIGVSNLFSQITFTATSSNGAWNLGTSWDQTGCSSGCVAGVDYPGVGDIAVINPSYLIQVLGDESCAEVRLEDDFFFTGMNAQLVIQNGKSLTVSGNVTLDEELAGGSSRLTMVATAVLNIGGLVTFNSTNNNTYIRLTGAGILNLSGDLSIAPNGFLNAGGTGATVNFKGTSAQTMLGSPNAKYYNVNINNSAGVTLGSVLPSVNLLGNINVEAGFLDNGGFGITGLATKTFTVADGATFKLSGSSVLPTTIQHVFASTSTVEFGGGSQTIGIPNNGQDYGNLTISGTGTKSLGGGANRNVLGVLTVSSSTLALGTGADEITLVSNASGTASLASISGAITGTQLTVQRYVATALGTPNWRELSSPLTGRTIADWNDDITTSGFTGSDGEAKGFISMYAYDETVVGILDSGYTAATNVTNTVSPGQGFLAWIQETSPITISVTGAPNSGSVALPITYTDDVGQPASEDGWNLLGNPFASIIDWTNLTRAGIDDGYWVFDPSSGNYASWNETSSSGTLGANGNIAHSQGFWAHATASPTLTVPQTAKTTASAGMFFKQKSAINSLSLNLSSSINSYYDEAVIRTDASAIDALDVYDNQKLFTSNPLEVPSLSILSSDQEDLAISSIADLPVGNSITIPIRVKVGITGTYTLTLDGYSTFSLNSDVILEDLLTSTITDIKTNNSYTFSIEDTTSAPRFLLHVRQGDAPTGIADEVDSENNVQVYPNPFETTTTFRLKGELVNQPNSDIQFMLYDQIGRLVEDAKIENGVYIFNRNGLDSGVYIYKIISNGDNTLISSGKLAIQ